MKKIMSAFVGMVLLTIFCFSPQASAKDMTTCMKVMQRIQGQVIQEELSCWIPFLPIWRLLQ